MGPNAKALNSRPDGTRSIKRRIEAVRQLSSKHSLDDREAPIFGIDVRIITGEMRGGHV